MRGGQELIRQGLPALRRMPDLPCDALRQAYDHPEHGDQGERLANLQAWARGEESFIKLGTFPKPQYGWTSLNSLSLSSKLRGPPRGRTRGPSPAGPSGRMTGLCLDGCSGE